MHPGPNPQPATKVKNKPRPDNIWNHVKKWTARGTYCWVNRVLKEKRTTAKDFLAHCTFCSRGGWRGGRGRTNQLSSATHRAMPPPGCEGGHSLSSTFTWPVRIYTYCFLLHRIWGALSPSVVGIRQKRPKDALDLVVSRGEKSAFWGLGCTLWGIPYPHFRSHCLSGLWSKPR